jgi:hypothetical protein
VEIKEGAGAVLRKSLPPTDSPMGAAQVRLGCVIGTHETSEVEIVQPMPLGLQGGVVMIPAVGAVGLSAPGLGARSPERDDNGAELRTYALGSLAPGQPLHLTVYGIPTRGQAGKWIASVLVGLLVLAAVALARKPRQATSGKQG